MNLFIIICIHFEITNSGAGEFLIQTLAKGGMNELGLFAKPDHCLRALGVVAKNRDRRPD
jgi:hypothetical protein